MEKLKVLSVFGTRPEAVKMAPVVHVLQAEKKIEHTICVTAQHREMLDQTLRAFGIKADYDLDVMRDAQTLTGLSARILEGFDKILKTAAPDLVLVHGDTTTSFVGALAAFYNKTSIGHVEAGLRSGNVLSPFPEEMNRKLTSQLSTVHFAPTQANKQNLLADGVSKGIYVTGNTVIDAMRMMVREDYRFVNQTLADLDFKGSQTVVVTAHRRENLGIHLENICQAILTLVERHPDITVVYPVHLNPAVQSTVKKFLSGVERIHLTAPLDIQDMHNLVARCHLVLTDSGGLQEEAPSLGKPVLVLRTETERPEAVAAGTVAMAGVDKENIIRLASGLLDNGAMYKKMANAVNPYGDGKASMRIAAAILHWAGLGAAPEDYR